MKVLIDTQILIWIQENNTAIPPHIRLILSDPANQIHVSQFSFVEVAIKLKVGKRPDFPITIDELIKQTLDDGVPIIQLDNCHIAAYDRIPLYADHRDPFDRLILATALAERMPVISADDKFNRYQNIIEIIWWPLTVFSLHSLNPPGPYRPGDFVLYQTQTPAVLYQTNSTKNMADVHTPVQRSYNMSKVRSKDTKPELIIRKFLHAHGFRYKLHDKALPGKPDVVLPKYKTIIFVHGTNRPLDS